ncbi:MAG: 50S ribosomal protein L17 [bacterium]|jgi:large subunit ribosomal protein L17
MTHRIGKRKLGLPSDQRRALLTGLVRALFQHDKIRTTQTRAKEVQSIAEKLVTMAKGDTLAARREVRKVLAGHTAPQPRKRLKNLTPEQIAVRTLSTGETLVKHVFDNVVPRFITRPGGYTRITKLGLRRGDAAPLVELAFLD